jgi:hypothetical protein
MHGQLIIWLRLQYAMNHHRMLFAGTDHAIPGGAFQMTLPNIRTICTHLVHHYQSLLDRFAQEPDWFTSALVSEAIQEAIPHLSLQREHPPLDRMHTVLSNPLHHDWLASEPDVATVYEKILMHKVLADNIRNKKRTMLSHLGYWTKKHEQFLNSIKIIRISRTQLASTTPYPPVRKGNNKKMEKILMAPTESAADNWRNFFATHPPPTNVRAGQTLSLFSTQHNFQLATSSKRMIQQSLLMMRLRPLS